MIVFTLQISVVPENQTEFLQSCHALVERVRQDRECLRCRLVRDTENDTVFSLMQEWRNRRSLNRHLRSDSFHLLRGAMKVLGGQPEMTICRRESAAMIERGELWNTSCR